MEHGLWKVIDPTKVACAASSEDEREPGRNEPPKESDADSGAEEEEEH